MPDNKPLTIAAAVADVTRKPRGMDENVWLDDQKIRPDVKEKLLDAAMDVWEETESGGAELLDITLTGSTTGPRWSPAGDLDVHLVVKFSDAEGDEDLVSSYFKARGKVWNNQHNVKVGGHPVEVYIQDADEPHYSSGVYSLLKDEWTHRQEQGEWAPYKDVAKKSKVIARDIRNAISSLKDRPSLEGVERAKKVMERLRELRKAGLTRAGEGSVENLSYKALRRAGYVDKLVNAMNTAMDELLSLET